MHMSPRSIVIAAAVGIGLMGAACHRPEEKAEQSEAKKGGQADQKFAEEQRAIQSERAKAEESLRREQGEYTDKVKKELDDYQKTSANLKTAATHATGAAKAEEERLLQDTATHARTVEGDLKMIPRATLSEWAGVKAKVDKDIDELRKGVKETVDRVGMPTKEQRQAPAPSKPH
jgi:hypothetical protein